MSLSLIAQSVWGNPGNEGKRIRKSFDAVAWQVQKRLFSSTKQIILPNGIYFKAYPDCVVSSALIYSDWPEYHEIMFVRSLLSPENIMIDVGANVGHISLLLADIVDLKNIIAFEPNPISFNRLVENWRLNDYDKSRLFQVALGSKLGQVFIQKTEHPETTVSVNSTKKEGIPVPLFPLDHFRDHWMDRPVGFLKVDVEGYEKEVFKGSEAVLSQDRPQLVMFESLEEKLDEEMRSILDSHSYVIFQLDGDGKPDLKECSNQNLFAAPEETIERVVNM